MSNSPGVLILKDVSVGVALNVSVKQKPTSELFHPFKTPAACT